MCRSTIVDSGSRRDPRTSRRRPWPRETLVRLSLLWIAYTASAALAGGRGLPSVCVFRRVTGHPCPLCGLSRSIAALSRGRIASSLRAHPLGPPILFGSGLWLAWRWSELALGRSTEGGSRSGASYEGDIAERCRSARSAICSMICSIS